MTAMMMTTKKQLNNTWRVAAFMSSDQAGMAITAIQSIFEAMSKSKLGSVRTGYLSSRNARSDMAVSRPAVAVVASGFYGHAVPVDGSSVASAATPASLGSDRVTLQRPTLRMHQVM
jgi:hypothetical protein